jgi:diacylglycerol kinase family enzyme
MRAVVLLNATAGSAVGSDPAELKERVRAACDRAGVVATVRAVHTRELVAEARGAACSPAADIVVVGGGDGTLSSACEGLVDGPKPLGILPLGTRNHFARDVGIPSDLEAAARLLAEGQVRAVDVGDVNGRLFLNNCSLGVYADLVRDRDGQDTRDGPRRWTLATAQAAWRSLLRFRARTVTLRVNGRVWRVTTPLVFVGNNRYETRLLALGRRAALDEGLLWVYVARNASRLGVLRLAARTVLGRLEQAEDFESVAATELELRTYGVHLRVAVDGELIPMTSPLRCRVRPRALRVVAGPSS